MTWVRRTYVARLFAGLLIASMLPAIFAPVSCATSDAAYGSYAEWVRAQLRVPINDSIEAALVSANESGPANFEEFVEAFLSAYEDTHPNKSVALVFTEQELNDEALVTYLQRRYTSVGDEGVLPRSYLTTAVSSAATNGGSSSPADVGTSATSVVRRLTHIAPAAFMHVVVMSLRTLSSARPLGP